MNAETEREGDEKEFAIDDCLNNSVMTRKGNLKDLDTCIEPNDERVLIYLLYVL